MYDSSPGIEYRETRLYALKTKFQCDRLTVTFTFERGRHLLTRRKHKRTLVLRRVSAKRFVRRPRVDDTPPHVHGTSPYRHDSTDTRVHLDDEQKLEIRFPRDSCSRRGRRVRKLLGQLERTREMLSTLVFRRGRPADYIYIYFFIFSTRHDFLSDCGDDVRSCRVSLSKARYNGRGIRVWNLPSLPPPPAVRFLAAWPGRRNRPNNLAVESSVVKNFHRRGLRSNRRLPAMSHLSAPPSVRQERELVRLVMSRHCKKTFSKQTVLYETNEIIFTA